MKNSKLAWLYAVAFILVLGFVLMRLNPGPASIPASPSPSSNISLTYPCQPGRTALDLLEKSASVEAKDSSFGKLVTVINGVSQGNGKYWLYFVDSKEATIGAQAYNCVGNEQIKWELK